MGLGEVLVAGSRACIGVILIMTNGFAEDIVGSVIGRAVRRSFPRHDVAGLPLVGGEAPYDSARIQRQSPVTRMPSGGFARNSLRLLAEDIGAGLIGSTIQQIGLMRGLEGASDVVICVGDAYLLLLVSVGRLRCTYFLPTARSDYIRARLLVEEALVKRYA